MKVTVVQADGSYPVAAPYHPAEDFPELLFRETGGKDNPVYRAVREMLFLHGLDSARYGSSDWNPLGGLIHPGERVLLKPNLITARHPRIESGWQAILTHGSVVRSVADYVFKAVGERGTVVVADAPQTDSSFSEICRVLHLDDLQRFYQSHGFDFRLIDLRRSEWQTVDNVVVARKALPGDPLGYVTVNLGEHSLFYGHGGEGRYYGADYDTNEVNTHHHGGTHEYVIARSALDCDVFINLPKLKTHKKVGATLALKNLVGINGDKNYLPHFTQGAPASGGDEFPDGGLAHAAESFGKGALRKLALSAPTAGPWLYRQARKAGGAVFGTTEKVVRSGNWHGNDTCWRMCLDLNRILFYADSNGLMRSDDTGSRKRYLAIVDGIISGEGNGPIDVEPVESGLLVLGVDPVATDVVAARLMGFDPMRLPIVQEALQLREYRLGTGNLDETEIDSNRKEWCGSFKAIDFGSVRRFRPHFGWQGAIEVEGEAEA